MFDSDPRNRATAATPARGSTGYGRRTAKAETKDVHVCPAHRWVLERRRHRPSRAAGRLPAHVRVG